VFIRPLDGELVPFILKKSWDQAKFLKKAGQELKISAHQAVYCNYGVEVIVEKLLAHEELLILQEGEDSMLF
jgi:hypothetical protein